MITAPRNWWSKISVSAHLRHPGVTAPGAVPTVARWTKPLRGASLADAVDVALWRYAEAVTGHPRAAGDDDPGRPAVTRGRALHLARLSAARRLRRALDDTDREAARAARAGRGVLPEAGRRRGHGPPGRLAALWPRLTPARPGAGCVTCFGLTQSQQASRKVQFRPDVRTASGGPVPQSQPGPKLPRLTPRRRPAPGASSAMQCAVSPSCQSYWAGSAGLACRFPDPEPPPCGCKPLLILLRATAAGHHAQDDIQFGQCVAAQGGAHRGVGDPLAAVGAMSRNEGSPAQIR